MRWFKVVYNFIIWPIVFQADDQILAITPIEQSGANEEGIILMQNFDPFEWEHVGVNFNKIQDLAHELTKTASLKRADWTEILPQELEIQEQVEYILGLICIDFCHWDLQQDNKNQVSNFYTQDEEGARVRGSAAMTTLVKKAYLKGVKIFDAAFMEHVSMNNLRPHFMGTDSQGHPMEIPWLEQRVKVLNEVGRILMQKWEGSFYHLLYAANRRAFNHGKGFVELLVRDFPRFRDEYIYRNKKIGIYKLAQLSVIALQSTVSKNDDLVFCDYDDLTLCADYQLPRSLRAYGILEYDAELAEHVDQEKLIPFGSDLEIELRMATIFAGQELKKMMNTILGDQKKLLITLPELDYLLWNHGRHLDANMSKHHLTLNIMY